MAEAGIERVAVIGGGMMGFGVAVEFARFGYPVTMYNTREETSRAAMQNAREALDLMAETELITGEEADAAHGRFHPTTDMEGAVKGADFVHEEGSLRQARPNLPAAGDTGHKHLRAAGHRYCLGDEAPGEGRGDALLPAAALRSHGGSRWRGEDRPERS